jgi:REP element-mobilizing transposase RayT
MRTARIVEDGAAYYHMMSRVVDRRRVFDDGEKELFRKTMRAVEGFSGAQILTWTALENHFHILLYIPERQPVADGELIRRLLFLYDKTLVGKLAAHLATLRASGQDEAAEVFKKQYTCRMYDLAEFGKTLKQRVSFSYNRRHQRKGTLWEERFKSVLVDGSPGTLMRMAAYIDLNAVRAGLVKDPKDYRFSGYGEAMGGSKQARGGLGVALGDRGEWRAVSGRYRQLLYVSGETRGVRVDGQPVRPGFDIKTVESVVALKGKLPVNEILRCRVRYFTDGAILGSRAFVEEAFLRHRAHFSTKRDGGAKPMKGGEWGDLFTARQLRVDIMGFPAPA